MTPPTKFALMRANRPKMLPIKPSGYFERQLSDLIELDVRTGNALLAEEIKTVGDLYRHKHILRIPNLSKRSLDVINNELRRIGFPEVQ